MGKFLLGFVIGAGVGAAAVLLLTDQSGRVNQSNLNARIQKAMKAAEEATARQEQTMWSEFHKRIENRDKGQPGGYRRG
ncbi:MAG: YtxH domain-containing protein [Chloroflexaceae bacterium]|nr:YtxH domain-containing protein [Chloroflexaceae bacterium]NJO04868.1 YtxH domain-containing protein [Chloroflexaceae bacterium]